MRASVRIHDYISGSSKSYAVGKRKTKEQVEREKRRKARQAQDKEKAAWVMDYMGDEINKMRKREDDGREEQND